MMVKGVREGVDVYTELMAVYEDKEEVQISR